jgi:hypothetical protein
MGTGSRIAGLVLCQAGTCRVAFAAQEVVAIEAARGFAGGGSPARQAFGEPGGAERVLLAAGGEVVGVDALEIDAEPLAVLPAPALLRRVAGGSLRGFVLARGALWPLISLAEFGRFLSPSSREAA